MNIINKYIQLSFAVLLIAFVSIGGCDSSNSISWEDIRADRLAEIQEYFDENSEAFESFRTAPLAIKQDILNFTGIQTIMFRLFPEIFPDIWGEPEEFLASSGFGPDPFDPNAFLPLGFGVALSETFDTEFGDDIGVNYVNLTCMGCHSRRVIGPDNETIVLVGGPNQLGEFSSKINQTVNDPRYTTENFIFALNEMPAGWVYNFNPEFEEQEQFERTLFNLPGGAEFFLEELKFASNAEEERFEETLFVFTYSSPDAPQFKGMPGSIDVFSIGAGLLCNPNGEPPCDIETALPELPGPADIPAAWVISDRPRYQWDDSLSSIVYREVLASTSTTGGDATAINLDNVFISGPFAEDLPAYPYPFDVDLDAADRGKEIYNQACGSCHQPGNNILMTPEETGTSPNRANIFTENSIAGIIAAARLACPESNEECLINGEPPTDDEIIQSTGGYIQIPLAGVWATSPYLHNGSIPTLYHLIAGDRPDTFYRGNITYDQELVGYTWDEVTNESGLVQLYDTSLQGYSNAGHTGPEFNGNIDWDAEPEMLQDLLEYLKTL